MKLNTRLQLRYDLLSAWESSTLALLAGEVAIAKDGDNLIIKVGEDGIKTWGQLPVANVTPAQLTALTTRVATLETDLNTATTGLKARLAAAEEAIDDIQELLGDGEGSVSDQIKDAVAAEAKLREDADKAINDKIGTVTDEATAETVYGAIAAEAARAGAAEEANADAIAAIEADYLKAADKTELAEAISAEKSRAEAAEKVNADAIDAIEADYLKAVDKTELQGNIDTVGAKVTTLIGDDANKSVRTIANEELAAQLVAEGAAESLDTLKEIAEWIQSHPEDAAAMNEAIEALEAKVVLGTDAEGNEYATVKAYVEAAIAALNIGDYAKAADLTALAARVEDLETKVDVAKVSTAIATAKQEAIDAAADDAASKDTVVLGEAQSYTDKLANGAVAANTTAIAAINNETTGILAQAKNYADSKVGELTAADGALTLLTNRVAANEGKLAGIGGTDQPATVLAAIEAAKAGIATTEVAGLVKASETVAVAEDGTMSIAKVSTDVLVQGTDTLVLCGGTATA